MPTYREFIHALRKLELGPQSRVVAHASLSAFGEVTGGADTVVGAMLASFDAVMMPTFTYRTMIVPAVGPPDNAMEYGVGEDQNRMAEFWDPEMPADASMGVIAETLRLQPEAGRSSHPILSFAGVNADEALEAQTLDEPLAPLRVMAESDADVLLLGVDHTRNTGLHYAEKLAGRKQFVRWALTASGVVECPGWPGCSDGFQAIAPKLDGVSRRTKLGPATLEAIPMRDLIHITVGWIRQDPRALLCAKLTCDRCRAVRAAVRVAT